MNGSTEESLNVLADASEVDAQRSSPNGGPYPEFMTVTRLNRILMAVMRGEDKETFGLIHAEEDEFWDSMIRDVADAKAGGYSLMLPSD